MLCALMLPPLSGLAATPDYYLLNGTLVGDEKNSFAILRNHYTGGESSVRLGDELIPSLKLVLVAREYVEVQSSQKRYRLKLDDYVSLPPIEYEVDRLRLLGVLKDKARLDQQITLIPYQENKRLVGVYCKDVQPGSFAEQLGFQRGDIIRRINDVELDASASHAQLFAQLLLNKTVDTMVVRNGVPVTLRYHLSLVSPTE